MLDYQPCDEDWTTSSNAGSGPLTKDEEVADAKDHNYRERESQ